MHCVPDLEAAAILHDSFAKLGAVALTGVRVATGKSWPHLGDITRSALAAWADCLRIAGEARHDALVRPLAGGGIHRVSVSAQTVGREIFPFPHCHGAAGKDKAMRLGVVHAAHMVARALDSHLQAHGGTTLLFLSVSSGNIAHEGLTNETLANAFDAASHLEHLHLYEETPSVSRELPPFSQHWASTLMLG